MKLNNAMHKRFVYWKLLIVSFEDELPEIKLPAICFHFSHVQARGRPGLYAYPGASGMPDAEPYKNFRSSYQIWARISFEEVPNNAGREDKFTMNRRWMIQNV